jgi:hypothetical protein
MNFSLVFLLGSFVFMSVGASCPGSKAFVHAKCEMEIAFQSTDCKLVKEEITSRMAGGNGWTDPHNHGTYELDSDIHDILKGSRETGDKKYIDFFELTFSQNEEGDCIVEACSESQVTSVIDFSTNYCNLHNLYCSSASDGCPVVKHDLKYVEKYRNCGQRDSKQCLSSLDGEIDSDLY